MTSKLILHYPRLVKPPALNMRLADQPGSHASYRAAKESYSAVLLLLKRTVKGPLVKVSFPALTKSSSHSSSSAVSPNTQIHPSPTRARAIISQPPGTRYPPRCQRLLVPKAECPLLSHLSHCCERGGPSGSNENY